MDERITLAHGAGGKKTNELIEGLFKKYLSNPDMTADDAAVLALNSGRIAVSTDGFIVSPAFFPGGNIGKLSVCGTVNDLACMGAEPLYITVAAVIEEGFAVSDLEKIVESMGKTAAEAGVRVVCGDTKVAGKGQADGIFITTTGIGLMPEGTYPAGNKAAPGDAIIVTGDVGRHGAAILLARNEFGIEADITSDCAPLNGITKAALAAGGEAVHVVRDATRGGVGTVLHEIASQSGVGISIERAKIPVYPAVGTVTEMLGLDPLYLACEGRMVIFCDQQCAENVLAAVKGAKYGQDAAIIGTVTEDRKGKVVVKTRIGGETLLPAPTGELLPRIC